MKVSVSVGFQSWRCQNILFQEIINFRRLPSKIVTNMIFCLYMCCLGSYIVKLSITGHVHSTLSYTAFIGTLNTKTAIGAIQVEG